MSQFLFYSSFLFFELNAEIMPSLKKESSLSSVQAARDFQRGSNQEEFQVLLASLDASTEVAVPVWATGHYTLLFGTRATTSDQWKLAYVDSLPDESKSCYQAATSVAKSLRILGPSGQLPHSTPGNQSDAWSCGLLVLQEMEARIRLARSEGNSADTACGYTHHALCAMCVCVAQVVKHVLQVH